MENSPIVEQTVQEFIAEHSPDPMDSSDEEDCAMSFTGSVCKEKYEAAGKAKWCLFAMLVGLIGSDGRELGDTDVEPYRSMKFRKLVVPTSQQYKNEVTRRSKCLGVEQPQCKYWNKEKLTAWLKQNPISNLVDRQFLLEEEQRLYQMLYKAEEEKAATSGQSPWTDNAPWIRLYCALYDDRTRPYLVSNNEVMNREELDARNSDMRPKTLYEVIADRFNDKDTPYNIASLPELHPAFAEEQTIKWDCLPEPITAEEVKKRLADSRAKLMKVISKWEKSGNGFGQRAEGDDDFGHMTEEQLEDGDNRASFIDGIGKEHLLLLWHFGDLDGTLQTFLNQLSSNVAVDCDNIHLDTSEVQNRRRMTEEQRDAREFRESIADSMSSMSYAAMLQELRQAEQHAFRCKEMSFTATSPDSCRFYQESYDRVMERVLAIKVELSRMDETRRNKKQRRE